MLKEAIEKILTLAVPSIIEDKENPSRCYSDKALHPITPPVPSSVDVSTLAGFVDLVSATIDNFSASNALVHVVDHEEVRLIRRLSDDWGRRVVYVLKKHRKPAKCTASKRTEGNSGTEERIALGVTEAQLNSFLVRLSLEDKQRLANYYLATTE